MYPWLQKHIAIYTSFAIILEVIPQKVLRTPVAEWSVQVEPPINNLKRMMGK